MSDCITGSAAKTCRIVGEDGIKKFLGRIGARDMVQIETLSKLSSGQGQHLPNFSIPSWYLMQMNLIE
jgi:hypothetical protein